MQETLSQDVDISIEIYVAINNKLPNIWNRKSERG